MNVRVKSSRLIHKIGLVTAFAALPQAATATGPIQLPEAGTIALIAGGVAAAVIASRFWRRK